jgi:hypothetical protein
MGCWGPILTWNLTAAYSFASHGTQGDAEDLFYPEPPESTFSRLFRQTRRCWGPSLTWILTGPYSVASYDTQGDAGELFLPRILRIPIQSLLTTRTGMLKIYSYPKPHVNWADADPWIFRRWNQVPRRIKHLLSSCHTAFSTISGPSKRNNL